jgi:hypothetical protein
MRHAGFLCLLAVYLLALAGCQSARGPDGHCRTFVVEKCDERSADVIITAEIGVDQDGGRQLNRIISLDPPDYPMSKKVLRDINGNLRHSGIGSSQASVDTFPFCEHIPAEILATGRGCPAREIIENDARQKGYRVLSVSISP